MAEAATASPRRGLYLPTSVVLFLVGAAASVGVAYIFATKGELAAHELEESNRVTIIEETEKHHDEAIQEMKETLRAVDDNVRSLLIHQGVQPASHR